MELKLKFVIKAKHKPKRTERGTKLYQGLVILDEDNTYKVHITIDGSTNLVLPFTKESYNLKDKTTIFSKTRGKYGYDRIVRNEWKAKFAPGDNKRYIPFAPNWIVNGYIYIVDGVKCFHFNRIITLNGYNPPVEER